jgi:uncharacterized protein YutE (UPF0331/DUF86 family)
VVRRDVVANKVGRARAWLNDAESLFARSPEEFRNDVKGRDLAPFYLFLTIQACIDLAAHWVADEGWGEPDDAGSAFDLLADRGVITRESAHGASRRNRSSEPNRARLRASGLRQGPWGRARGYPVDPRLSRDGRHQRRGLNT